MIVVKLLNMLKNIGKVKYQYVSKHKYPTMQESTVLKIYNEKVGIEKNLNQLPAERITNLTPGIPLVAGPVIRNYLMRKSLDALFKIGGHICYGIVSTNANVLFSGGEDLPLKNISKQQCGDVASLKDLDFEGKLQQMEKWKSPNEQEKKQDSSIISELFTSYKNITFQIPCA